MKKHTFSFLILSLIASTTFADVIYCPQPSQITQEKMAVNGYWLYEATIDGHAWAQFGGYAPTKGANVTTFSNTTIFPYSTGYVGDMQCNYKAEDGTPVTLWTQVHIKPDWTLPNNAWKNSVSHNGIYPCGSNLIAACPAITVQNT